MLQFDCCTDNSPGNLCRYLHSPVFHLRLMKASCANRETCKYSSTVVNAATIKWFVHYVTDLHTRPHSAHYTQITSAPTAAQLRM